VISNAEQVRLHYRLHKARKYC